MTLPQTTIFPQIMISW